MRNTILRLLIASIVPVLIAAAGPGIWSSSGDCTPVRFEHAAGLLADGRLLVTGGQSNPSGTILASAKLFQAPSSWSDAAPMLYSRSSHSQTLLSDGRALK